MEMTEQRAVEVIAAPKKRKVSPNSLANLRPIKKGEVRNPGGRPKGLERIIREQTKDGSEIVRVFLSVFNGEVQPDGNLPSTKDRMQAAEWLTERGYGKVKDQVELSGDAVNPVTMLVAAVNKEFYKR